MEYRVTFEDVIVEADNENEAEKVALKEVLVQEVIPNE